ncbi:MAG: patatin-like phospholipase family protein [Clostridium sp.]|uniref:patatin-like phospholipase family protein n=1 Tax=Clostridium sp. TaxID=1506 RepID=UPI003F3F69AC
MKIGLVLSGGGGKGAYELGVWKALIELDLEKYIKVFSGTSIGAFNAVLFAQNDLEEAEALWDEVTMEKLAPISKAQLLKKGFELVLGGRHIELIKKRMAKMMEVGIAPKDGAKEIIDKYLHIDKVRKNDRICYAACTQLPDFTPKYFRLNDYDDETAKEIVVASATLPRIYDCTEVLGNKYIDGGVADNTPIQPVYGEGCDIIIVVMLSKDSFVDRELYPNTNIIELAPRKLNESTIKGTLNLDMESKKIRIDEGYKDTMELLKPIMLLEELKIKRDEEIKHPKLFKMYNWLTKEKE